MEFSAVTEHTDTDWQQWAGRNIAVRDGGIELASEPSLTVDQLSPTARDITVDADGTLYALQESGTVSRHDKRRSVEDRLWRADGGAEPRALCVVGERLYVVDEMGTLAVVSTRLRQSIGTIETGLDEPVTITAADGRLYLLDAAAEAVFTVQHDGGVEAVFDSLSRPLDMAVEETGDIYVLEAHADHRPVQKQASTGELLDGRIPVGRNHRIRKRTVEENIDPGPFPLSTFETTDGDETSVMPTQIATGTSSPLLVMGSTSTGDETLVGAVDPGTSSVLERHRLDGRCRVFRTPAASPAGVSYAVTGDGSCLRLDSTDTHTQDSDGRYRGRAYRQFDAGGSIQWHRLTVGCDRPTASSQLRLSYLASDDRSPLDEPLSAVTGLDESLLASAGIDSVWELLSAPPAELAALADELTVDEVSGCLDAALAAVETALSDRWQTVEPQSTDVLLSEATGRYLTVRLELVGSPTETPRVSSLRAFWPRQSYLQYLPELYQDDADSAAFLEQFLSVFGTVFTGVEREIETVTRYFDPAAVPSETLPWLASWIGADAPVDWPTAATRELVASAPQHYRKRGTREGLQERLALYLRHISPPETPPGDRFVPGESDNLKGVDHGLCILEPQALDGIESRAVSEAYETALPGEQSVAVYAGPFDDPDHREAVETIIEAETPAHVRGSLVELEPEFRLGVDSFLGSTTRLSERQFELGAAALGETAVLD
ncbi:phage tail protein [Halohasta litorea]|uniref:Phage tail protein n=1 Tax=Halohasta litorea TaxID=869891 RepID=A0ABD6DAE5_9EURY|nr:phage tail protein [Halohasta litorea]